MHFTLFTDTALFLSPAPTGRPCKDLPQELAHPSHATPLTFSPPVVATIATCALFTMWQVCAKLFICTISLHCRKNL